MYRVFLLTFLFASLVIVACSGNGGDVDVGERANTDPVELTLMSHDSFSISESVLGKFELENNVRLSLLPAGDAGAALNQAILTRDDPLADIFFGVDNSFMSRALEEEIFEPYESPVLDRVPDELEIDQSHRS